MRVAVAREGPSVWLGWDGQARRFGPRSGSDRQARAVEREARAPMTGRIVKLAVAPGAAVRAGEVLVVMEAMKMEYRIAAPRDGTVESTGCKEGDRVDLGQVLVTLAP